MTPRILLLTALCAGVGCAEADSSTTSPDLGRLDAASADLSPPCGCSGLVGHPDHDSDGFSNIEEGCLVCRDSDGDGVEDWKDHDSDDDGLSDRFEGGGADAEPSWPADADGDGVPDVLDPDSDNDGLLDGYEAINYYARPGCCLTFCGVVPFRLRSNGCWMNAHGCGQGQTCAGGRCTPRTSWECARGATSPRTPTTLDGVPDSHPSLGLWACPQRHERPWSTSPRFRKRSGLYVLILPDDAAVQRLEDPGDPRPRLEAIDYPGSTRNVAGFFTSWVPAVAGLGVNMDEVMAAISSLSSRLGATVNVASTGKVGKEKHGFDLVTGIRVKVSTKAAMSVSSLRDELAAALVASKAGDFKQLPEPLPASGKVFTVQFGVVRSFRYKQDANLNTVYDRHGHPVDSGDPRSSHIQIMGGVSLAADYSDPGKRAWQTLQDLGSMSAVNTWSMDRSITRACEGHVLTGARNQAVALERYPVAASLRVALDGVALPHHPSAGYRYDPHENRLLFHDDGPRKGKLLTVGYYRWGGVLE